MLLKKAVENRLSEKNINADDHVKVNVDEKKQKRKEKGRRNHCNQLHQYNPFFKSQVFQTLVCILNERQKETNSSQTLVLVVPLEIKRIS